MFWCLVRLSTGALCGGLYANPLEMAIQSAVACSEAKDDGLLVSRQLMERILVWVVSFSLAVEDGFLFIMDKSFTARDDHLEMIASVDWVQNTNKLLQYCRILLITYNHCRA